MSSPHLLGLTPPDLVETGSERGLSLDLTEARRVLAHLVSDGREDLSGMSRPVSKRLRARLAETFHWRPLQLLERVPDPLDNSIKFLFRSPDGALSEAVGIGLEKSEAWTVCLSSQAGCAMGCDFCATGRLGRHRHLEAWEIVSAFCTVRDGIPGRVTGAVFMGQGEPFHNYEAVIQAARVLNHPCGGRTDHKTITISTVGLVPQIRRYAEEGHKYRLIVSLTSAIPEKRQALLPIAARWTLPELAEALGSLRSRRHKLTLAWVLIGGVNDGPEEVEALVATFGHLPFRLNLIDVNDFRPGGYARATVAQRDRFIDALVAHDIPFTRRYSVGRSTEAACGMLASRHVGGVP